MTSILRSDDMRRRNRLRIIQIVRRQGAVSRGAIAQIAGLSPATVSTITSDLIAEGVLVARGAENGAGQGRGRPSIDLSINPRFRHAVLLVLKVDAVNVGIVDYAGAIVTTQTFDLDLADTTADRFLEFLAARIRQVWAGSGLAPHQLARIAIGVQGTTDIAGQRMLRSPMTPLTDLPIAGRLETEFAVPVRLANDCDLIARALNWRDPERYHENFAAILLAHGVGMGLFLRGQIVNGTKSSGTEFGHMLHTVGGARCRCGSRGCIEAYAGDYAIVRRYRAKAVDEPPPNHVDPGEVPCIAEKARAGDERARETFASAGRALGSGLAGIYALVDPFRLVFAGHAAAAFDLMEPALRETLKLSNASAAEHVPIDLYTDEMPLVLEGCAIGALAEIDANQADNVGYLARV